MFRPAPSPETLFILHTIMFIMSGLVLMVLLWTIWNKPARRQLWSGWTTSFLLLVTSFGLGGWASYRLLVEPQQSIVAATNFAASSLLETAGLAVLVWFILSRPLGRWAALAMLAVGAELFALLHWGPSLDHPPSVAHSTAAMAVSLFGLTGVVVRARSEFRYAGLAFLLLAVAHFLSAMRGSGPSADLMWSVALALMLFALTGLALAVERRSEDLFIQVFIRLNVTFIFLAGVLMALASQAERNRRMDFSRRELDELAEFLRGHVMYYLEEGQSADEILTSPVIFRRVVSDFGHHPDLQFVRLEIGQQELEVSIDEDGMISRKLTDVGRTASQTSYRSPTVIVGEWPIFSGGKTLGAVVLEETRLSINRDTAQSILVIFLALTSAVTVASLLIGVIVYQASERLRQQVLKIEQSERQLMQAAKLASLGELVSGVAHEINNPLGVILSRTDYLREVVREGASKTEVNEDLDAIHRQAGRITRIVRDLLSFSRPSPMELRPVPLRGIVDRSVELTGPHLRQSAIRLIIDVPVNLPELRADPDRLQQVLINLINNAVDAMPAGGELRIRARTEDRHVILSVADTGMGIAREDLKRVFDPFFSTKQGTGTGLGLSISYGIVRDHGGQIWAESQPERGSTFLVSLPAEVSGA
jgi:signal transduction histidine kinase